MVSNTFSINGSSLKKNIRYINIKKKYNNNRKKYNKLIDNKKKKSSNNIFNYTIKGKIIKKYVKKKLNKEEKIIFHKNGILPCQYCRENTYIGKNIIYDKIFNFTHKIKKFEENEKMNIDHFIQRSYGGSSDIDNGVVCCKYCNTQWLKGTNVITDIKYKDLERIKSYLRDQYATHGPMIDDETEELMICFFKEHPYCRI